jgi:ATP-dependent DNA helicase RecQ
VANRSGEKIKIIQSIDRKIALDDLAKSLNMSFGDLLKELETIVHSGTRINIDYYIGNKLDEDLVADIFEFFRSEENFSIEDTLQEFKDDDLEPEDVQLVHIKFVSELGN